MKKHRIHPEFKEFFEQEMEGKQIDDAFKKINESLDYASFTKSTPDFWELGEVLTAEVKGGEMCVAILETGKDQFTYIFKRIS